MAKKRSGQAGLAKAIERSAEIIYLVGEDFTIRYANQACAEWIGLAPEELSGAKCFFRSEGENEIENKLAGLCPPPDLFDTNRLTEFALRDFSLSTRPNRDAGQTKWRNATAYRLNDCDGLPLAILVVSPRSASGDPFPAVAAVDAEELRLHDALIEIHHQSRLSHQADSLVGISVFSNRIRRQAKIAAAGNSDLLVFGPPGSGREHLARTIHAMRGGPAPGLLIPICCPLADRELLQSAIGETLAQQKRSRLTNDATPTPWLLLQDVDKLSSSGQTELLAFLLLPDFPLRILSTATSSLIGLAESNQFDANLARYLGTMTIELVGLRQRIEDIPLLAQAMLERGNDTRKQQLSGFDKISLQRLQEYAWPGNLDQLREVVESAATQTQTSQITVDDLPKKFNDLLSAQRIGVATETTIDLADYLEKIEQELIRRAIQQARGNKTKAAKLLGVNRAKLLRRMQYFQLEANQVEPDFLEEDAFEEID